MDLLRPIAKSARLMDDSAAAHQIAEDIYSFVSEKVFTADGSLDPARCLELRHKKRRDMDLTVGGTSAALEVLVDHPDHRTRG